MIGWIVGKFAPNVLAWAAVISTGVAVAEGGVILVQELRIAGLKAAPIKAENRALRDTVTTERRQADTSARIEGQAEAARVEYRDRYRTILQEVPVYVTPEIDRRYPLPVGFVRLHDAATTGSVLPSGGSAPGEPYDAPSDVAASEAASVIVGNYAGCTDDRAKLLGLQAWAVSVSSDAR